MTLTNVVTDREAATIVVTAEFPVPPERVWQVWADPRQLERWWGPQTHPATVVAHDLTPGGVVTYYMTGPDGEKYHGWWRVLEVDAPSSLRVEDGFGESPDDAAADLPVTTMSVALDARPDGGTVMTVMSAYPSADELQKVLDMGVVEGLTSAFGQLDQLLAVAP